MYPTGNFNHDNQNSHSGVASKTPGVLEVDDATVSENSTVFQHGEQEQKQVETLARQLSRHATRHSQAYPDDIAGDLFPPLKNSELDPFGPNFNGTAWTRKLLHLNNLEGNNPGRTAGFAFKDLYVHGFGSDADYQPTVTNLVLSILGSFKDLVTGNKRKVQILNGFDGLVESGEMLVVLGPPGSGCSTLLKTIAGEMNGIYMDKNSYINYQGITPKQMRSNFRGEAIYTAEVDVHFPQLTVGDTLAFAAQARAPRNPPAGLKARQFAQYTRDVVMAMLGISHTINTRVGNDFIRGVSGGERKRVSIAEACLAAAPLQCWDNSTRGLDAANALEFCKTLRTQTQIAEVTACVAIYQAPGSAYEVFDKVVVLYEGEQIYFGPITAAKQFFVDMGFECPEQQTTPDFLTSLTSALERRVRPGFENQTPRTAQEFARRWKNSETYATLRKDIDAYAQRFPENGEKSQQFRASRRAQQSKQLSAKSPYTLSFRGQVALCLQRGFQRLAADPSLTLSQLFGNTIMALVVSSVFYNLPQTTGSFYQRGALLFFAILLNAFSSALEILTLYAQRPIVEKHQRYAFYHPSAEALASMLTDIPYKITNSITFNLVLYFMSNLRRAPGNFFFFLLISFFTTLTMSMFFRSIAALSRTLAEALAPAAVLILALVIYTGFTIPTNYMLGWSRWINYLDPVGYAFESLMINEFAGRNYTCSAYVPAGPGYNGISSTEQVCSAVGSTAGSSVVEGTVYLASNYQYDPAHKWRNFGILIAFMIGLMAVYLLASEYITAKKSKGEVLVFRRGHIPTVLKEKSDDVESGPEKAVPAEQVREKGGQEGGASAAMIPKQTAVFHWKDVCYDIKIKGEERRILDHVDGFIKPGQLTALMGVSGAGKTTLLDVLATRVTMGVVTGSMLVDGQPRDLSFQRKTGYVQQQDLHLATSTVREALQFSALLRQPVHIPRQEKLDYVEEILKLLDMEAYPDAVIGVPGEGLNVEQRKRLTIGVELVAKPELLLFLDEPTSGLDSQTSYSICDLLVKLTAHGQAILCTIHQPSAMLFERFDRLLFLAKGGKTIYFGEVGKQSKILRDYFEKNGAYECPPGDNPAEWMLSVIGAAPGSHTDIDWHNTWLESEEWKEVRRELARLEETRPQEANTSSTEQDPSAYKEFAAPMSQQMIQVTTRVFQQYWRTPSYIWSKIALCTASSLFIGFSFFKANNSQQGLQNQLFAIFMLFTIFGQMVQQIMPQFVTQRSLYEVRERPAKTYSWKVFMASNIIVELPWNTLMAVIVFLCWYFPIGMYRNAIPTNAVNERGGWMFLFVWSFLMFTSTFTNMVIAGIETAENGGNIANLLFSLTLIFCGVLSSASNLPRFWIFMYRVSPFTYLVEGILGVGLSNTNVVCAENEYLHFQPPAGSSCGDYMSTYISSYGGYLQDTSATSNCSFCAIKDTNVFLDSFSIKYENRGRDFGILMAFCVINIIGALLFYWLFRVPKKAKMQKNEKKEKKE